MPPRGVKKGSKRARQYEHIKKSEREAGRSASSRGGRQSGKGPGGRTREQLYDDAKRLGIDGRSKMSKAQLQRAVAGAQG